MLCCVVLCCVVLCCVVLVLCCVVLLLLLLLCCCVLTLCGVLVYVGYPALQLPEALGVVEVEHEEDAGYIFEVGAGYGAEPLLPGGVPYVH